MKSKQTAKKIVAADGLNIFYWITWNRSLRKPFAVLHPAASMNHSSLEALEHGLQERSHPTVILDPRGVGYSDKPVERSYYSLDAFRQDLETILTKEGIEKPLLMGHSMGFMPLVAYAAYTTNAQQLTGICASYNFYATAPSKLLFYAFDNFLRYVDYVASITSGLRHAIRREQRIYPDQSQLVGSPEWKILLAINDVPLRELPAHIASGKEMLTWNISSYLRKVSSKIPVLMIHAQQDKMIKLNLVEQEIRNHAKPIHYVILQGRHSLPVTNPSAVLCTFDSYIYASLT